MQKKSTICYFALLFLVAVGSGAYVMFGATNLAGLVYATGERPANDLDETVVKQIGVVQDQRLTEISGMGRSNWNPEHFWVHNDSGHPAEVFLISASGRTLATVRLEGAKNIDWEDLCVFKAWRKSYVCVGDVGDNDGRRWKYQLYLFEEPEIPADSELPTMVELATDQYKRLEFEYEDGPGNCEAIAYSSDQPAIYLCKKRLDRSRSSEPLGIYRLPLDQQLKLGNPSIAKRVGSIADFYVTGMDFSNDSTRLLIRNYVSARILVRSPEEMDWVACLKAGQWRQFPLPMQRQGESICFSEDGQFAYLASEFGKSPIWRVDIEQVFSMIRPNTASGK